MAIKTRLLVRVGCDFVVHTQVKAVHLLLRKSEKYVSVVWVSTQSDDLYSPGSEWDCDTILRNTSASNTSKQPVWGYAVHPLRGWSFRIVSPTCASACRCYIDFRPWLKLFAKFEYIKNSIISKFSWVPGWLADLTGIIFTMSHWVNWNNPISRGCGRDWAFPNHKHL